MVEVVFVHGALVRDGSWWWGPTARLLAEHGVPSRSVRLPSCGELPLPDRTTGLAADADALREMLDDVDEAVLVGHSYGGTVIAEAGARPAVRHLVLISSYLPDVGASQASIMSGEPDPVRIATNEDGTLSVSGYDAASFGTRFLQDADEATQQQGWDRVVPQAASAFITPTTQASGERTPSTYLVCTQDGSTSVALQRFHAARATESVDLPTGHHPFVTRPDLVAEQVRGVVTALQR